MNQVVNSIQIGSITFLTLLSSIELYWYVELERRLLVLRHAFVDDIGIFRSPLLRHYIFELLITCLHIPEIYFTFIDWTRLDWIIEIMIKPFINFPLSILRPEFQLFSFVRLLHIMKFMREHHFMRYNRTEL